MTFFTSTLKTKKNYKYLTLYDNWQLQNILTHKKADECSGYNLLQVTNIPSYVCEVIIKAQRSCNDVFKYKTTSILVTN